MTDFRILYRQDFATALRCKHAIEYMIVRLLVLASVLNTRIELLQIRRLVRDDCVEILRREDWRELEFSTHSAVLEDI